MKRTTKTFSLVPSVRTKGDTPAPMSVLPAVPVILSDCGNVRTLGLIDPTAALSCISESLLADIHLGASSPERHVAIKTIGGMIQVPIVTTDLIIADAKFIPWVRIQRISFAVLPKARWVSDAATVILGYSGCLEHLAVKFNFQKRVVSISAPVEFDLKQVRETHIVQSSRLREAEVLASIGSYDSAIVMAAAAIEEIARSTEVIETRIPSRSPLLRLKEKLPSDMHSSLESVTLLRNEAIHGPSKAFTKAQAERVIQDATRLVTYMDRPRDEADIVRIWNQLLAPSITAHAQPTALKEGTLFVSVDSSAWLHEIVRYRRREIFDLLQNEYGKDLILRISYRVQ